MRVILKFEEVYIMLRNIYRINIWTNSILAFVYIILCNKVDKDEYVHCWTGPYNGTYKYIYRS